MRQKCPVCASLYYWKMNGGRATKRPAVGNFIHSTDLRSILYKFLLGLPRMVLVKHTHACHERLMIFQPFSFQAEFLLPGRRLPPLYPQSTPTCGSGCEVTRGQTRGKWPAFLSTWQLLWRQLLENELVIKRNISPGKRLRGHFRNCLGTWPQS